MPTIGKKNLLSHFHAIADGIARADVDQHAREAMAESVADALYADRHVPPPLARETFVVVASDPLVKCAGAKGEPCPHGREIRVAMHDSTAEDGRAASWSVARPVVRCVSCGAREFIPGYPDAGVCWA